MGSSFWVVTFYYHHLLLVIIIYYWAKYPTSCHVAATPGAPTEPTDEPPQKGAAEKRFKQPGGSPKNV